MPGELKIEIPISLKGGNEGEKVGRQIGEKIASQLDKSLKAIGVPTAGKTGGFDIGSAAGLTKGLKGMVGKLGAVGAAIAAVVAVLAKSSPYLKGILSIFGRAFMIFFRPFGDFLATLLRPLAILMMKMAIAFLKWTRPIQGKITEAVAEAPQIEKPGIPVVDFAVDIANWAMKVGVAIGAFLFELGKGAFDLGVRIGEWLFTKAQEVGESIGRFLADIVYTIGQSLTTAWEYIKYAGQWVWERILQPAWNFLKDVGQWIWEQILLPAWNFLKGAGEKIWEIIKAPFVWLAEQIRSIWDFFRNLFGGGKEKSKGSFQTGTSFVPGNGLYELHRGEQVIPRSGAGKSVIFKPIYQITTNGSSEMDIDEMVRRAGRLTEMDLKKRGII